MIADGIDLTERAVDDAALALEDAATPEATACLSLAATGSDVVTHALSRVDEMAWAMRMSLRDVAASLAGRIRQIGSDFDRLDGALAGGS